MVHAFLIVSLKSRASALDRQTLKDQRIGREEQIYGIPSLEIKKAEPRSVKLTEDRIS